METTDSKPTVKETGSVSWGTMRSADLVPRFLNVLYGVKPDRVNELCRMEFDTVISRIDSGLDYGEEELSTFLNEQLWEEMQEIAPEGFCFGSHPGDDSDYGFWELEDEDELEEGD